MRLVLIELAAENPEMMGKRRYPAELEEFEAAVKRENGNGAASRRERDPRVTRKPARCLFLLMAKDIKAAWPRTRLRLDFGSWTSFLWAVAVPVAPAIEHAMRMTSGKKLTDAVKEPGMDTEQRCEENSGKSA